MLRAFASTDELTPDDLAAAGPPAYPRPERLRDTRVEIKPAKAQEALNDALKIHTVHDLLEHFPRPQLDRREARTIAELEPGADYDATIVVEVRSIRQRSARRRNMQFVEATVADASGSLSVLWFNQPWLVSRYPAGTTLALHGRLSPRGGFTPKEHERVGGGGSATAGGAGAGGATSEDDLATTLMAPTYPATALVGSARIRQLQQQHRDAHRDVVEPLPAWLRVKDKLPDRAAAVRAMHFPSSPEEQEQARARLAYEELLVLQLALLRRRANRRAGASAVALEPPGELTDRWLTQSLPFTPTEDQRRAMRAIDDELVTQRPMQRLLMGEVGSGKTVVALYAMLRAVEAGAQAALMAPTETLAEQHFATVQKLMPGELLQVGLLTGSTPGTRRRDLLAKLASGELTLLIGTHALIEDPVTFNRLAVVVVDEQHRFGVNQRRALDRKAPAGLVPHVLHMTATPIPRTMALAGYGDLDVTALHQLPAGRHPIATHVASGERERARAYERIREELRQGRQAFVVCPLVEESEALQARAATAEYERLQETEFKDFRVQLLHGQLKPREKQEAMAEFAAGGADVLVATTVIEVGIDVPNASVMLVENAERYGISQLHQLRGRIGRGPHQSVCILFGPKESPRLSALAEHRDGFRLAEIDLELRGEGEMLGVRQSGMQAFRVAVLPDDAELQERARLRAETMIEEDPELQDPAHVLLDDLVEERYGEALEPIPA